MYNTEVFELKTAIKTWVRSCGYGVVNCNRRWGINVLDDIRRIVGNRNIVNCIFDVGANVGRTANEFANEFPAATIHAFEPVEETYGILTQATSGCPRIHCHPVAMGNSMAQAAITLYGDSGKSSFLESLEDSDRGGRSGTQTVQLTTIDNFMAEAGIQQIDILKTDTEGFDLEVLKGAEAAIRKKSIRLIFCEFHHYFSDGEYDSKEPSDSLVSLSELNALLANQGYRLLTTYTDGVSPDTNQGTYNALFISKTVEPIWQS